jgi:NADPH:quinone reductase-like Zn-dependent oxidoreductase
LFRLSEQIEAEQMSIAVQFSDYGTSEVLRAVDVAPLTAGPGQVRLAVRAAGVNPVDWKIMQGLMREQIPLHIPAGLGSDVAGVVDQVGDGVTAYAVGDEVLGTSLTPSYAQSALADPAALVTKPTKVPWDVAASLAGAGGTAWTALDRLGIAAGETLLIHAAAGGVGTFAVQLAIARGARVIGTAGEHNHEHLRSIGAVPVTYGEGLADRVRAIAPQGVDAVLDASGRGEIPVSIELAAGPERVLTLVAFDAGDTGIQIHVGGAGENGVRALHDILALIEEGRLRVPIWRTYPLTETAAALDASRTGHLNGKIVLVPA